MSQGVGWYFPPNENREIEGSNDSYKNSHNTRGTHILILVFTKEESLLRRGGKRRGKGSWGDEVSGERSGHGDESSTHGHSLTVFVVNERYKIRERCPTDETGVISV